MEVEGVAIPFQKGESLAKCLYLADVLLQLPNTPYRLVNLTFKDMHYTVTSSISNEKLELLKGIDGFVEAGKMTALMVCAFFVIHLVLLFI